MPKKANDKNEIIDKFENVVNTIKNKVIKKEVEQTPTKKATTAKTSPKAKNSVLNKKNEENKKTKTTTSKAKSTKSPDTKTKSTAKNNKKVATIEEKPTKEPTKKVANRLSAITKSIKEEKKAVAKAVPSKKSTSKQITKTTTTTAKKTAAKTTTKKTTPSKKATTKKSSKQVAQIIEYYDLPYRYNQTVVKILAQTPKMLFVYWDIADKDREKYKQYYGEDFFTASRPVLIIHNETMNYSFELEINDFANSWYIQVNDANCKYTVELGRRPNRYITTLKENYVYISSSNKLDAPNDHILFEHATPNIKYKNIKNNQINIKDFSNSAFIKKILQTYSISTIEELYEKLYQKDLLEELKNGYFTNPSSSPSSNFK